MVEDGNVIHAECLMTYQLHISRISIITDKEEIEINGTNETKYTCCPYFIDTALRQMYYPHLQHDNRRARTLSTLQLSLFTSLSLLPPFPALFSISCSWPLNFISSLLFSLLFSLFIFPTFQAWIMPQFRWVHRSWRLHGEATPTSCLLFRHRCQCSCCSIR